MVNEVVWFIELVKFEDGYVLVLVIVVSGVLDVEVLCWDVGEVVEFCGCVVFI